MNKFFLTLVLVFSTLNVIHAQDGFVKFLKDTPFNNRKFTCLKGEIFAFKKTTDEKKIDILLGDTIFRYDLKSSSILILPQQPKSYADRKDEFVKSKKGGYVFVNVASVSTGNDTIRFIPENGEPTLLATNKEFTIEQSKSGQKFRLLIPNTPTIFYTLNGLAELVQVPIDSDSDGIEDSQDKCPNEAGVKSDDPDKYGCPDEMMKGFFASLVWWHYLIILLGLGGIGFGVWKIFFKRKQRESGEAIYVTYNGNKSLSDFAEDNHIDLDTLLSLNKKTINQKYRTYNPSDRKDVQKDLKNLKLCVGYGKVREQPPIIIGADTSKETIIQPSNFDNNDSISQQLKQVESNLLDAIRMSGSRGNDNSNEINKLSRDLNEVRNEKNKLETEKRNLDSKINQLKNDKDNLEKNIDSVKSEKNQKVAELNLLQEKVISVEYLTGYCDSVLAYLKLCNEVSNNAFDFFNRVSKENPQNANGICHLLMNFQNSINSLPIGNWTQIVQDIKETGVTNSKQVKSSFKQLENTEDRKKQFQRLLFSELLVKYSSSILILAEAFSNIGRFQVSAELANAVQSTFAKHVSELRSRSTATGLESKYVPLFKNFEEYARDTELANTEKSFAYKGLVGIEKEAILEIVSYGVKTSFDDTKTLIILA
jgi:hypothetical protein